jgi:hypothetical protein
MSQDRPNATASPSRLTFLIVILTAVLTTVVTLTLLYILGHSWVTFSIIPEDNCWTSAGRSICFFENTLSSDGMIAVLSNFYTNLIVILVAIITLIGVVTALSVRYSAKQHVEAELPHITEYFFTSQTGRKFVEGQFAERSKELAADLAALSQKSQLHEEYIAGFSDRIEKLEYQFEDIDTGQTVSAPEEGFVPMEDKNGK